MKLWSRGDREGGGWRTAIVEEFLERVTEVDDILAGEVQGEGCGLELPDEEGILIVVEVHESV